jgi:hypothetical protein
MLVGGLFGSSSRSKQLVENSLDSDGGGGWLMALLVIELVRVVLLCRAWGCALAGLLLLGLKLRPWPVVIWRIEKIRG